MDSGQHAAYQKPSALRRFFGFLIMVAVVVAASFLIRTYVIEPFQIPSGSMEETIVSGDMVFAEKVSIHFEDVKSGDIVVFADPQVPSRVLIKRVIATEGQTVNLQNGKVYIDGVQLNESYAYGSTYSLSTATNVSISYPYTVPKGQVWVMGDNREHSSDSRYFGSIDTDTIYGKAICIYWPLDHITAL